MTKGDGWNEGWGFRENDGLFVECRVETQGPRGAWQVVRLYNGTGAGPHTNKITVIPRPT